MASARHLVALVLVLSVLVGHHLAVQFPLPCGLDNSEPSLTEPRVVGGWKAEMGEFPHQALLARMVHGKPSFCGGIILDEYHVLTAAHCMEKMKPQDVTVHVGSTVLFAGEAYPVANITIHHLYDTGLKLIVLNDIALLKTTKPINFKLPSTRGHGSVNRVCMPKGHVDYRMGDEFIVTGWGQMQARADEHPNELQTLQVPYLSGERCKAIYEMFYPERYHFIDTRHQICTGGQRNEGTCYGDSGGPLVRLVDGAYELVGIVSGGTKCGDKNVPVFYTRVDSFLDWIEDAKKQMSL